MPCNRPALRGASEPKGNSQMFSRNSTWNPRPESGLDCPTLEPTQGKFSSQSPANALLQMLPFGTAVLWDLTKETIDLPLGCLQGGHMC
jgi:hypothetical protein